MAAAATLVVGREDLLRPVHVRLINPLVYCNMDHLPDDRFRRWLLWYNAARDYDQPAVWLGHYGPDTYLSGDSPFALASQGALVCEQTPADQPHAAALLADLMLRRPAARYVDRPCLLACGRGEWTWGHWLLGMLPKIVLTEHLQPKRFTYAVPAAITVPGATTGYIGSVLQSLSAYGIEAYRLLRIEAGEVYRFANLFDVIDTMSDGMHPGVIAAMQNGVNVPPGPRRHLTAVMRGAADHRSIVNAGEIDAKLVEAKAVRIDPACASFAEQVHAFRESETIVADLGSNLSASIYAPPETGIVTLGPSGWKDAFFVHAFQRQHIYHADIRGVAASRTSEEIGHAPYLVDPKHFSQGLMAVLNRENSAIPMAAGRLVARAPGPPVWELRFGAGGNAASVQAEGFAAPEAEWTWSIGPRCALKIPPFDLPEADCWLEIFGVGYTIEPHLVSRPLSVVVNDVLRKNFDIDDLTRLHVEVPAGVLAGRRGMKIEFHHPVCPSPQAMGTGQDSRALGFRFVYVTLRLS